MIRSRIGKVDLFLVRCIIAAIILSLFIIIAAGCAEKLPKLNEYARENIIMDTLVRIRVCSPDPQLAQKAMDEAFTEFIRIANLSDKFAEKNLSNPEISDVYRINKNAGIKPVSVSDDTLKMLERSNYFAGLCNGAFDVTVGPLMDLWGFSQSHNHLPSDIELKSRLALVGYRRLIIDKAQKTVFLPEKGMEIDLGGIVKGYATDRAVEKLRQNGITSAIINAGGNIYALGSQPDGSPWLGGIQNPRSKNNILAVLRVRDTAIVTSGDYERYFIQDGIRYHHILDPSSGKPARKAISTTIVASNATDADVLSTTLFILGPGEGSEFLKDIPGVNAVFVDEQQNITCSKELNSQIEFQNNQTYTVKRF